MTSVFRIVRNLAVSSASHFSLFCVGAVAAAGSVALFAAHETKVFGDWAASHYVEGDEALASNKVVKLPPLEDAAPMSRIVHTADNSFANSLRSGRAFRRTKKSGNGSKYIRKVKRSNLIGGGASNLFYDPYGANAYGSSSKRRIPQSGLYRTMCVRSCDGFMWPVSFSTTKTNFRVDANICRSSCAAPTRLYHYENPGQEPKDMVDSRGRTYNALPTAWRYQQQHVSSCKCRPDPWEPQALARHTKYAALKKKGKLKRYLRQASRKARRLSRRASIGHVVVNSSFSSVEPTASSVKKASRKTRKTAKRRKASSAFSGARGFSNKSYKAKSSGYAKNYSSSRSRQLFRKAFGVNR